MIVKINVHNHNLIAQRIVDKKSVGYKATIPDLNGIVFGKNRTEIEVGATLAIQVENNINSK